MSDVLCQHYDDQRGRCVRLPHGSEIRHRYQGNQTTAGQQFRAEYETRRRQIRFEQLFVKIGRYKVHLGEAVGLDSNGTIKNEGRGWLGILKGAYEQNGTIYAEVVGAKLGDAVRERVVPVDRLIYIRPGSERARKAKIRVGRAV